MERETTVDQNDLAQLLKQELSDWEKTPRYICIYGESGGGKTAIVKQTLEDFPEYNVINIGQSLLFKAIIDKGIQIEYFNDRLVNNKKNVIFIDHLDFGSQDPDIMKNYVSTFINQFSQNSYEADFIVLFIGKSRQLFDFNMDFVNLSILHHEGSWGLSSAWSAGQNVYFADDVDKDDPYESKTVHQQYEDDIIKYETIYGRKLTALERLQLRAGMSLKNE